MEILIFILKRYWKEVIASIAASIAGFIFAFWIQGIRIDSKNVSLQKKDVQIQEMAADTKACHDANKAGQETIENLKKEISSSATLCKERVKAKEKTVTRIQYIDSLQPSLKVTNENKDGNTVVAPVRDPILDELNGMFNKANSKN